MRRIVSTRAIIQCLDPPTCNLPCWIVSNPVRIIISVISGHTNTRVATVSSSQRKEEE